MRAAHPSKNLASHAAPIMVGPTGDHPRPPAYRRDPEAEQEETVAVFLTLERKTGQGHPPLVVHIPGSFPNLA
uniref:Uncharacterized protein n=1 Tax=Sphaerodactylus townsendi TaxID=933632 RepID=A0ACB8F1U1_9SAUR